jgi:hypothetical protein
MWMKTTDTTEPVNGLRTLEMTAAVLWISEALGERLSSGPQTVSTVGTRSRSDQELLGLSHVLLVVYPFVIELALKSLWECLHAKGHYKHIHDLGELFRSLSRDADDKNDAKRAQNEARQHWSQFQSKGLVSKDLGALDDFLDAHANDFLDVRYYNFGDTKNHQTGELKACLLSILGALSTRDPETWKNLLRIKERGK